MFNKIRERREEKKRHDKEVARILKGVLILDSQQPDNYMVREMEYRNNKLARRREFHERLVGILKLILFVPSIKILDVANLIFKFALGASAFTFFYGVFLAYKNFIVKVGVNNQLMIVCLIAPFVLSFATFITDYLAELMEENL